MVDAQASKDEVAGLSLEYFFIFAFRLWSSAWVQIWVHHGLESNPTSKFFFIGNRTLISYLPVSNLPLLVYTPAFGGYQLSIDV